MQKNAFVPLNNKGLTLVELTVAVVLLVIALSAVLGSLVLARSGSEKARRYTQVMNALRQEAENVVSMPYGNVIDRVPMNIAIDLGPDNLPGTADDITGTIQVDVADVTDMDGDGNMDEEEIDVTGDGQNDRCKPVTITLAWTERSLGGTRAVSESLSALVSQ